MSNTTKNTEQNIKHKKTVALISFFIVLIITAAITVLIIKWLTSYSEDDFRDYILSFGIWSWLVLLSLQFLQVFIALIPGELLETAAGFIFGPFFGTVICYLGVALASAVIFRLTKRYGIKLVELFISGDKIRELGFLKTERRRDLLIFIIFFIPGTPKDLLTYFAGLTDIPLSRFLILSLTARIPSVVSSTVGGHLIGEGNYLKAVILYAVTGAVSLAGIFIYNKIIQKKCENRKKAN